jgi:hypothetical protein
MKWIAFLLPVSILILLCGCGRMLPGAMYDLRNGQKLDFAIETSRGAGSMTAYNPSTGETFDGVYSGVFHGGGVAVARAGNGGCNITAFAPPSGADASGILKGDKGTVISVYLDINPGFRPTGHGIGRDNNGVQYQVHF